MNSQILISLTVEELQELIKASVKQCLSEVNEKKQGKELMNFKETCEYLGCSRSALNKWKATALIPYQKLGKRVFFFRNDIDAALKESRYKKILDLKLI